MTKPDPFDSLPHRDFAPKVVRFPKALDPNWWDRAACKGVGNTPEGIKIFFPGPGNRDKVADRFCSICPVSRECDNYANETDTEWGIWGGVIRERTEPKY